MVNNSMGLHGIFRKYAKHGNIEKIVSYLDREGRDVVDTPDDLNRTALSYAAKYGQTDTIRKLLQLGANANHADKAGWTPIFLAAMGGRDDAVDALIEAGGADVNHTDLEDRTALSYASEFGQTGIIRKLLELGANANQVDTGTWTPIFLAAMGGHDDAIDALLEADADANHADLYGRTALFVAANEGHPTTITKLARKVSDINTADKFGQTALFAAARRGNIVAIDALVSARANVDHADHRGFSALSVFGVSSTAVKEALIGHGATLGGPTTAEMFLAERDVAMRTTLLRQTSISLQDYIIKIVNGRTDLGLGKKKPFNISLNTFSDDLRVGMFFRYGYDTVVSIYYDPDGSMRVSSLKAATAPICTGDGRVIYTKKTDDGKRLVYENGIDLQGTGNPLCHSQSGPYEKNWGCFRRSVDGNYFIVYSVIPLRIFKVGADGCSELPAVKSEVAKVRDLPDEAVVKTEYPNFEAIEKIYVDNRDENDTGIFRGGTRGVEFRDQEYLFVGHVTLYQEGGGGCFPNWFTKKNTPRSTSKRMYFMYFFTVRLANGIFKLSRISSCFQPPSSGSFHRIVFPCGIARRKTEKSSDIVVSFGRDDSDCLVTSYAESEVDTMLAPVQFWNERNYVFHPNYAASLRTTGSALTPAPARSVLRKILARDRVGLIGTSPDSDGRFNPAITNIGTEGGSKFFTAWRKMNGSVANWKGYNQVAIELCSLEIKQGRLVYKRESDIVEFQAGNTTVGGEDPRLITENNCPLLMVNDLDANWNRRMYVHNLSTDDSAMTIHPFCHNASENRVEKNWGPFYADKSLHFVYSVVPLIVGKVGDGFQCPGQKPANIDCTVSSTTPTPGNLSNVFQANGLHMRGGTPGLRFNDDEYLFVGHAVQDKGRDKCFPDFAVQRFVDGTDEQGWRKTYPKLYTAFFFTIARTAARGWEMKRLSCCSQLPEKRENFSKIHFPSGLARADLGGEFKDAFVVSFGEKDVHGGFCAVNRKFLEYVLVPTHEWDAHNYVVDINYFENVLRIDPDLRN